MLPSCKEISQLASDNLDTPIKGRLWLKIKFHLLICKYCRRYQGQMDLTIKTISTMSEHDHAECNETKNEIYEKVEADFKKSHGDN